MQHLHSCRARVVATAAMLASLAALASACGSTAPTGGTPSGSGAVYAPKIDPADFSTTIDNPFFPLVPGTRTVFEGKTSDGLQRTVVEVTHDTKKVMGVKNVIVHDIVTVDGQLSEDTYDWYAQDRQGNVWYFGEATKRTEGGTVSAKGSFEAGVDGALPGIIMEGHPKVGDVYRQEYYKGIAEDMAEVLSITEATIVRAGSFKDLVMTKDYNPLDSSAPIEHKYFARGIGFILVVHVTGPAERVELVKIEKF